MWLKFSFEVKIYCILVMISITGYWSLFVAADSSFFGSVKQIWQRPYHNLFMISWSYNIPGILQKSSISPGGKESWYPVKFAVTYTSIARTAYFSLYTQMYFFTQWFVLQINKWIYLSPNAFSSYTLFRFIPLIFFNKYIRYRLLQRLSCPRHVQLHHVPCL